MVRTDALSSTHMDHAGEAEVHGLEFLMTNNKYIFLILARFSITRLCLTRKDVPASTKTHK